MDKWTREEEIIVLDLYCKIPFKSSSKNNPEVIKIANLIGRTPSAVNMKIGNFGSFDNRLKEQGIVGLSNASKLDKEIFYEFNGKWDELAYESKKLIAKYNGKLILDNYKDIPNGYEKETLIKQRVHQQFFRQAVLASYNGACCITGLSNPELLVASHIKPWKDSTSNEKTDPKNGLCLNSLHDKAFDRGFITISDKYEIIVSNKIRDICNGESVDKFFNALKGHKINLPEKFLPQKEYLQYHNDCIYENW
ncbi:HNH endonuclease [uncultured Eubacterium sp.]|uniref:HNH endonuclease n=1 Tax=uncultured Eubacterium sp. TaxID=165185 RepID=UPI0025E1B75C|nr:HNH endonuclease [uncultured Eubacterium sp.]